jgi:hypothetical protein
MGVPFGHGHVPGPVSWFLTIVFVRWFQLLMCGLEDVYLQPRPGKF